MATVYLARDVRQDRPVAIKAIHPELAQAVGIERFLREIRIAASLNHPHILPLLDSGAEPGSGGPAGGLFWYAMPYVEGESLRTRLEREKQLPLADALRIGRDVAAALAYAHGRGIIHRDIKPENILLAGGEALVADFGIARAVTEAGRESLTPRGLTVGTPAYMSPEQAAGEPSLDGRSDVYSLGCVLYEMLAGEPPFTGPTAQAILAKRLSGAMPSLQLVREAVTSDQEAAIQRALARVPADRFASAAEFAEALGTPSSPRLPHSGSGSRRRLLSLTAVLATLLVLVATTVLIRSHEGRPPPVDRNLLAVAPFTALAPSLRPWSEGIVDVLSRSLDGAGALHTVPPTVSLKGWTGPADRASAAALGHRTGAGLVLFGALERRGPDSLAIRAVLLDLAGRRPPSEVEVAGDTLRLDAVVDSLAIAVLRDLGRTRAVGAVRRSPLGAKSLPALKAFLQGEQYFRRNLWDSALARYDRAIGLDSTFALAYRRLRMVLSWGSRASETFLPADPYVLRHGALELNHGLAPRDSLLILIDSLSEAVINELRGGAAAPHPDHFANRRRLLGALKELERRYPGDPEVWYVVGEVRTHVTDPAVATKGEALEAFDRAIGLDSSFGPAYIHTPGLAIAADLGDPERARAHLAAYLRLNPTDDQNVPLRLAADLLDSGRSRLPDLLDSLDTAQAGLLWSLGNELTDWPDSAETAVRVRRSLAFGQPSFVGGPDAFLRDSLVQRRILAFELTHRGHLGEAWSVYPRFGADRWDQWMNPYAGLARLSAIPADTASRVFRRLLRGDSLWNVAGLVPALVWWYGRGDTMALARLAARADFLAEHDSANPALGALWRYEGDAAHAYIVLARGDSVTALGAFAALPDSVCGHFLLDCGSEKLIQARLLAAAGRERQGADLLDRWAGLEPLAVLERARLGEQLGDREMARRCYQFVAAIWLNADTELQPYVEEARAGLERLSAEPTEGT